MKTHSILDFSSQLFCLFLFLSVPFALSAQSFQIKGDFKGSNTEEIVLSYYNEANEPIADTIKIQNSKFETSGTIGGVQQVYLIGKTTSKYMDDPNIGFFFLEPGNIEISLEENKFKEIEIKGSPTQTEYLKLDEEQALLREKMDNISTKLNLIVVNNDESKKKEKVKLEKQWEKNLAQLKKREIDYAYNNPQSYLSAYYGNFYKRNLPKDSLDTLYDNFSPKVKNTVYAESIRKLLGRTTGNLKSIRVDFTSEDSKGKNISLNDFKGNYVLLDFWAGWCKPCLANHSTLKKIHQKFAPKGLKVLGVSFDASKEEWLKSIEKENLDIWQHVFVGLDKVRMDGSISSLYGIQPIPAYILLDKNGIVVERYMAADSSRKSLDDLQKKLKDVLK